jgi:hypothetical protein
VVENEMAKVKNARRPWRALRSRFLHRITGLYMLRAFGPPGFRFARSFASLIPTQTFTHILPALVFAAQSPYPGWQNIVNSRTLYDIPPKLVDNIIKIMDHNNKWGIKYE